MHNRTHVKRLIRRGCDLRLIINRPLYDFTADGFIYLLIAVRRGPRRRVETRERYQQRNNTITIILNVRPSRSLFIIVHASPWVDNNIIITCIIIIILQCMRTRIVGVILIIVASYRMLDRLRPVDFRFGPAVL